MARVTQYANNNQKIRLVLTAVSCAASDRLETWLTSYTKIPANMRKQKNRKKTQTTKYSFETFSG